MLKFRSVRATGCRRRRRRHLLTGCSQSSAQQTRTPAPDEVVATVGSASITLAQVDEKALQQSTGNFGAMKLSQALFEARRIAIDELIDDALLDQDAAARKLDKAKVVEQEITSKVAPPSDEEAAVWYGQNQPRLQGATLDQARDAIKAYLVQQRTLAAATAYMDGLRAKTAIRVMLDPPRQVIAKADRPAKGPANAPVEIIEFSDFQCPFCLNAFPTVNQVLSTYGDRIHFVYRHYPLANHPRARPAAEAAQCAHEQGKFWEYHDRLFGNQARSAMRISSSMRPRSGSTPRQFNACYDSQKYKADVDTDIRAGDEAGVSGTPAFYINGRMLSGAQPFEAFKRIIDEELNANRLNASSRHAACERRGMPILDQLSAKLDRLAAFEAGPFPVVSLYLNTQPDQNGRDHFEPFLRKELAERMRTYPASGPERESLDKDAEKIRKYVGGVEPSVNGVADLRVRRRRPVRNGRARGARSPSIGCSSRTCRISIRSPGSSTSIRVTRRSWRTPTPPGFSSSPRTPSSATEQIEGTKTRRHKMGGWSQARYQRHIENFHLQHAKEIAETLARIVRDEPDHIGRHFRRRSDHAAAQGTVFERGRRAHHRRRQARHQGAGTGGAREDDRRAARERQRDRS